MSRGLQDALAGLVFATLGTVLAYVIFLRAQRMREPEPVPPVPIPQPAPVKPDKKRPWRPWRPGDEPPGVMQ